MKPSRARKEENMRRTIKLLMKFGYFWNISVLILNQPHTIVAQGLRAQREVVCHFSSHSLSQLERCESNSRRQQGNCLALEKAKRDENEDHEPGHEKIRSFDTNLSIKTNKSSVHQMPRRQIAFAIAQQSLDWCKQSSKNNLAELNFLVDDDLQFHWEHFGHHSHAAGLRRTSAGKIKE